MERRIYLSYINDLKASKNPQKRLSSEEEVELFQELKSSIKILDIATCQIQILDECIFRKSMDSIMEHNLLFVVNISRQYENSGMPLNDLIQEGNIGMYRAALNFRTTVGVKFITYAVHWIRQAITSYIAENNRIVKLPANIIAEKQKINKARNQMFTQCGYVDPFVVQWGSSFKMKDIDGNEVIVEVLPNATVQGSGIMQDTYNRTDNATARNASLDSPIQSADDEIKTLIDRIPSRSIPSVYTQLDVLDKRKIIEIALKRVKSRNREIVKDIYGIDREYPLSSDAAAKKYGVTSMLINAVIRSSLEIMKDYMQNVNRDNI